MKRRDGSVVQAIKSRLNLVDIARRYVELRRAGGRWMAPCPFHQETKPSFSINEEEGFFYCFGCQASGDLFDFYGRINGLDFRETLEQLAEEAGVALDDWKPDPRAQQEQSLRRQCLRMYDVARAHFVGNLAKREGQECRDYMQRRAIAPEIIESFELGWSLREWQSLADTLRRAGFAQGLAVKAGLLATSDSGRAYDRFRGRLIFPIKSLAGQVIAFGGRIIAEDDQAKYINSSDSPIYKKGDHLYGLYQARRAISQHKVAMLTEGYMDVLTLHQFGYNNAVGVLGTALTPEQVKRLSGFCSTVELLFDGDNAGRKAALRSCEMLLVRGMRCKVVLLPQGEDIDSLLHGAGRDAFESIRNEAPDGLDFCMRSLAAQAPRDMLDWTKGFLAQVEQPELLSYYITRLAGGLGLNEAELRDSLAERVKAHAAAPAKKPVARGHASRDREIMTFAVKVTVAVYVICMCLYFFGDTIFAIFGITLDAFRIGAGALLFLSAVSLVRGPQPAQEPLAEGDISVVPLAIPITVGPATTGALMVMGATVRTPMERVMGSVSLLAAVLTVGGLLYLANPIERMLGRIGISILTKLTGLILAALAAQIIFTGIRNFLG